MFPITSVRRNKRISFTPEPREPSQGLRITYEFIDGHGQKRTGKGEILSLSEAGLFIFTQYVPLQGSTVVCWFQLGRETIRSVSRVIYVCRVGGEGFRPQGFGVRFVGMAKHYGDALRDYVSTSGLELQMNA